MASAQFVRIDRAEVRTLVVTGDVDALAQTRFRAFLSDALVDPPAELFVDFTEIAYFEASSVEVLAHFLKVAAATDLRLRVDAGTAVRRASGEHADAEWLRSHFEPFVAPTNRAEPLLVAAILPFRLARRDAADSPVLVVAGEVDMATADEFSIGGVSLLDAATVVAHLDLAEVAFFDSSGIAALVSLQCAFDDASVRLVIAPSRAVARTLELTGLTSQFTFGPAPVVVQNEPSSASPSRASDRV
ncbi:MAG: STAS domain-containing protein [Acidimicrobiia bacterium]